MAEKRRNEMDRKIKPAGTEDYINEEDYLAMLKHGSVKKCGATMFMSSTAASTAARDAMSSVGYQTYTRTGHAAVPNGTITYNGPPLSYGSLTGNSHGTLTINQTLMTTPPQKKDYNRGSLRASLEAEVQDWCGGILKR